MIAHIVYFIAIAHFEYLCILFFLVVGIHNNSCQFPYCHLSSGSVGFLSGKMVYSKGRYNTKNVIDGSQNQFLFVCF